MSGDVASLGHHADGPAVRIFRKPQWIYIVPVALAPLAHIFVTATATFPRHRRFWLGLVGLATIGAVTNRMWLMADSGYPGAEGDKMEDRFVTVPVMVRSSLPAPQEAPAVRKGVLQ